MTAEEKWWALFRIAYSDLPDHEIDKLKEEFPLIPCQSFHTAT